MPFISEEIWHLIKERNDDIVISNWPKPSKINTELLDEFEDIKEIVAGIRTIRMEQNLGNKEELALEVINNQSQTIKLNDIISKLGKLSSIKTISTKPSSAFSSMVKSKEFFIPVSNTIDIEAEVKKLSKELDYNKGFLNSVERKLNNHQFIKNAPEQVIVNEKNKMTDTKSKIEILTAKINSFLSA